MKSILLLAAAVCFAQSPGVIVAGTDGGVRRSTDGGRTWRRSLDGMAVTRLASGARVLYAATREGLYATSDGETWTVLLPEPNVTAIAVDPSDDQRLYAAANGRLWASFTGGREWTPLNTPAPVAIVTVDPFNGRRLYISATHNYDDSVSASTDRGETWRTLLTRLKLPWIVADPVSSGRLYTSIVSLQTSYDHGLGWTDMGPDTRDLRGVLPAGASFAEIRNIVALAPHPGRPGDLHGCIEAQWTQFDNPDDPLSPITTGRVFGWAGYVLGLWAAGAMPVEGETCDAVAPSPSPDSESALYAAGPKIYRRDGLLSRRLTLVADLASPVRSLLWLGGVNAE